MCQVHGGRRWGVCAAECDSPLATMWMELKCATLSKLSQRKTITVGFHAHVEFRKQKISIEEEIKNKGKQTIGGVGGGAEWGRGIEEGPVMGPRCCSK